MDNVNTWILIALLMGALVGLVLLLRRELKFRDNALAAAVETARGQRQRAEEAEEESARQLDQLIELQGKIMKLATEKQNEKKRRPAKMESVGPMTEEAVAEALVGTETSQMVKAINAKITAKIVDLSDRATDAPRETMLIRGETVTGYTADQRMHDAGGAAHLADLLAELQEMTKARTTEN